VNKGQARPRKGRPIARTLLKERISTEPHIYRSPLGDKELTIPAGSTEWIETTNLQPGDELQEGKQFGLTNDQHWRLIEACDINNSTAHSKLLNALRNIGESYNIFGAFEKHQPPLAQHRENLKRISKLAKKLKRMVEAEPLMFYLLWGTVEIAPGGSIGKAFDAVDLMHRLVTSALAEMESKAAFLATDERELRRWRQQPAEPLKSAERRFIWKPFLTLWADLGRPLGYSEDGPIIRALRIIHEAFGIPPPNGEAVRQVINDTKGRGRAPKKNSRRPKLVSRRAQ
jgi:hypothetical protein